MRLSTSRFRQLTLTSLAVTVLGGGAFLTASELLIRDHVREVEPFSQSVSVFWRARDADVRNAAFGDSEIARGLMMEDPNFYNLAVGGEHLGITRAKVLAFLSGRTVDRIVLPATAATLNHGELEPDARTTFFAGDEAPELMLGMAHHRAFLMAYWRTFLVDGAFDSTVRFLRYGGQIPTEKDQVLPFAVLNEDQRIEDGRSRFLENIHPEFADLSATPALRIYRELIETTLANDGQVCLLQMPYAPEFKAFAIEDEWNWIKVPEIWRQFAEGFGTQVQYVNAIDWVHDYRAFRDATHLTMEGGREVTPKLLEACFEGEAAAISGLGTGPSDTVQ